MHRRAVAFMVLALLVATGYADGEETYRVVIKFGSVCCGINFDLKDRVFQLLSERDEQKGIFLDRDMVYWGEEGEFNLCLKLSELSVSEQKELTERLQLMIGASDLVKLEENIICKAGW